MCFGGSSAATDRKTYLGATSDLSNIYKNINKQGTSLFPTGTAAIGEGLADTSKAAKYYSDILSGDPTKVMSAVAPESKALTSQADVEKKNLANFGNRTGGKVQTAGSIDENTRAAIADVISKARGGAASGLASTGSDISRLGLGVTGEAIGAEGTAGGLAGQLAQTAANSRKTSQDIHDAAVQQWADVVAAVLFA